MPFVNGPLAGAPRLGCRALEARAENVLAYADSTGDSWEPNCSALGRFRGKQKNTIFACILWASTFCGHNVWGRGRQKEGVRLKALYSYPLAAKTRCAYTSLLRYCRQLFDAMASRYVAHTEIASRSHLRRVAEPIQQRPKPAATASPLEQTAFAPDIEPSSELLPTQPCSMNTFIASLHSKVFSDQAVLTPNNPDSDNALER